LFKDKLEWVSYALEGAVFLSREALIQGDFKEEICNKL